MYQLIKVEGDGSLTQLTKADKQYNFVRVSHDGSTVAFLSDPNRDRVYDLGMFILGAGAQIETKLLSKLNASHEFVAK